ncbi:hypothetical protein [Ktedonobacter racemifer]|uniref:Uncharacterized protein n=1 Tax=Ktedonobacter racemifer DSM 44963 TaxID=485913 RepID=D6TGH6_KTERA|nr:hypothetical protein [Ktedonobacter racemifer]EFH90688.1 hypothetical protein Krac_12321 [Ktedonobacter racemifer DSM 44963]
MPERPHSRYTRAKTWAALYCQHLNACYAIVPFSATNNSLSVIRCKSPEETHATMEELLQKAEACAAFYGARQTPEHAPAFLARARQAVVLAKSSDYHYYHLSDYPDFRLVICGLHDSYVRLPIWEMRTNKRYKARETAVPITSPTFERLRCTQFGHNILMGALIEGDQHALTFLKSLPRRTQNRLEHEKEDIQTRRYQGRPLAFLTDEKRHEIGDKISAGLKRYYAQHHFNVF